MKRLHLQQKSIIPTEARLVKFYRFLPAMFIAVALLFTAGCGESKKDKEIKTLTQSQKDLAASVTTQAQLIDTAIADLQKENQKLESSINTMQKSQFTIDTKITDLQNRLAELQNILSTSNKNIEAHLNAAKKDGEKGGIWQVVFIVIIIVIIIIIIFRLMRSRSEFEDEDDDFEDFEDDDDLGFEDDEEFGDDADDKNDDEEKK